MDWFTGDIAEAVSTIKRTSKCSDDDSKYVDDQFNSVKNTSLVNVVCVRMEASSHLTVQFSAVYTLLTVPCVYLIGSDGKVIDTKLGRIDGETLENWIDDKLTNLHKAAGPSHSNGPNELCVASSSINSETPKNLIDQTELTTLSTKEPVSTLSKDASLEERVDFAKRLVDMRRQQKEDEEKIRLREEEVKRRDLGKSMQDYKERQRQRELSEALAERRKDEAESRRFRDELKRQIAEDKCIRDERWKCMISTDSCDAVGTNATSVFQMASASPKSSGGSGSNVTKLQIRLTNGGTFATEFANSASLSVDVRDWIGRVSSGLESSNVPDAIRHNIAQVVRSGYRFRQLVPSRLIELNDETQTMIQLGLYPSATLFIVPIGNVAIRSANSPGIVSTIYHIACVSTTWVYDSVGWTLGGFYSLGRNLVSSLFGSTATDSNGRQSSSASNRPLDDARSRSTRKKVGTSGGDSQTFRRQGNVARLSHMPDDSDDEQARWNGNSTEQL